MKKIIAILAVIACGFSLTGCSAESFAHNVKNFAKSHSKKITGPAVKRTLSTKEFKSLDIDLNMTDLEINQGKNYKVVYNGKKKLMPTAKVKNGILTISQPNINGVNAGTNIVTIYLPKKQLNNVKISGETGDIDIDNLNVKSGSIHNETGDVYIKQLTAKIGFKIANETGDLTIDHTKFSGYDLSVETGDLSFNGKDYEDSYEKNANSKNVLTVTNETGDLSVN